MIKALIVGGCLELRFALLVQDIIGNEAILSQKLFRFFILKLFVIVVDFRLDIKKAIPALLLFPSVCISVLIIIFVFLFLFLFVFLFLFLVIFFVLLVLLLVFFALFALFALLLAFLFIKFPLTVSFLVPSVSLVRFAHLRHALSLLLFFIGMLMCPIYRYLRHTTLCICLLMLDAVFLVRTRRTVMRARVHRRRRP